jgi:integrase/recombinase XerD
MLLSGCYGKETGMSKVGVIRLRGPLSADAAGFAAEVVRLGYSKTGRRQQMDLFASLSAWLDDADLGLDGLDGAAVEAFLEARRAATKKLWSARSLAPLAGFLGATGRSWPSPARPAGPCQAVVDDYERYLKNERGLAEGTIAGYVRVARDFLDDCSSVTGRGLEAVTAAAVVGFVTRSCSQLGLSASRGTISALRCLLRYLALEGLVVTDVDSSILSVAGGGQPLPRGIGPGQIEALLASCDRRRGIGRRDYVVLMLLARLGLRGGEVVGLCLEDIDWRSGEITVRGKGSRIDRLPLPVDVGEALAAYLRRGRPRCGSRAVFVRHQAPFVGFAGTGALRGILERACTRAGVAYACPHRLRHTAATAMLRQGASLAEIGQVLRHGQARATAIYASVDDERLRVLAPAWPVVIR